MAVRTEKHDAKGAAEANSAALLQSAVHALSKYSEVFDNVVREDERADLMAKSSEMRRKNRNEYHWFDLHEPPIDPLLNTLTNIARRVTDLHSIVGIEYWCVILEKGEKVEWHTDKDEMLFTESGQERIESCKWSLVCYLDTTDLVGGEIEIEGIGVIEPKVGRCVKMEGSLRHRVKRVLAGRRVSLVLNLWTLIPRAYQLSSTSTASSS